MEFLRDLIKYGEVGLGRLDYRWLVGIVAVGGVISSSWGWQKRKVLLEAGASPTPAKIEAVIEVAVDKGDYSLARKLYENKKVLGIRKESSGLEEMVYPERKLKRELREQKKILEESPYLKTALVNVARIYESLGKKERAKKYWELVKWVSPIEVIGEQ